VLAYRGWAQRAGSQSAAFIGEQAWTSERRFARVFERLALPGLGRGPRYELLATLGRLGLYDLRPAELHFADDEVTVAAKRVFGIGDTMNLERRAADLAAALALGMDVLDLALLNWGRPEERRATYGSRAGDGDAAAIAEELGVG
jgi:hypothetical protein